MDGHDWIVIATGDSKEGSRIKQMFEASRLSNPIACMSDGKSLMDYLEKLASASGEGKAKLPKLLLLDLALPDADALGILTKVKSDSRLKELPVIALGNAGAMTRIDAAIELGASTYLHPNFSFAEFYERSRFLKGQWTITR